MYSVIDPRSIEALDIHRGVSAEAGGWEEGCIVITEVPLDGHSIGPIRSGKLAAVETVEEEDEAEVCTASRDRRES